MRLSVENIKQKVGDGFDFELEEKIGRVEFKGEDVVFVKPVSVRGRVENLGKGLIGAWGEISTAIEDRCYRCLAKTCFEVKLSYNFKFSENPEKYTDEDEVFLIQEDTIDLSTPVVNEIILNLPSKILCSPDCRGLCPYCGADLNLGECGCRKPNVDPRLRVLEKLLDSNNRE
ncbi:uncharacterized protein SAMN05660826_00201 [Caldanaerovirga acetigignens]|uniref:DUF177 domain-containing protein n=1 Tax=Caldanaerovirga acetigignens TaxID=447595 RepID=A0A1M7FYN1_9FIRM|nr:YceD family protein [Caldanaerovirga acetigignens]SHM09090.1 uncharacterized protein SAMN05660826_00201 [Caldanaerovirga acetigignens]